MIFSICDYFTGEQLCRAPPTATLSQTLQCPMQKSTFFYNPNLFLFTPPFSPPPNHISLYLRTLDSVILKLCGQIPRQARPAVEMACIPFLKNVKMELQ